MALYRKYRPATFAEVVGQEHVTDPLSTALDTGRISHAYLFSGPRGCGKTSSARILARSLNCVEGPTSRPCGVCSSCVALAPGGPGNLDVVELDAASHGGVDDTRELRDRAFYAPAESRYRVFIVDEAHMVTTAGFNALLKIVEEPPAHLIFVFATTEPDKVLPTIRSRTHHYPFRLLPPATMRGLLGTICEQEGVAVEEAVYPLVIRAGGGSPRDSLSVLDQLLAGAGPEGITYQRALALLGVTDIALIDEAVEALAGDDGAALFGTVDRVVEAGHDPRRFATDLLERMRDLILLRAVPDAADRNLVTGPGDVLDRMRDQAARIGPGTLTRYAELLHEGLGEMRGATAPRLLLEVVCARMLLPSVSDTESATLQRLERLERGVAGGALPPASGGGPGSGGGSRAAGGGAPSAGTGAPGSTAETTASSGGSRRRGAEALAAIRAEKSGDPAQSGTGSAQRGGPEGAGPRDAGDSAGATRPERSTAAGSEGTGGSAGAGRTGESPGGSGSVTGSVQPGHPGESSPAKTDSGTRSSDVRQSGAAQATEQRPHPAQRAQTPAGPEDGGPQQGRVPGDSPAEADGGVTAADPALEVPSPTSGSASHAEQDAAQQVRRADGLGTATAADTVESPAGSDTPAASPEDTSAGVQPEGRDGQPGSDPSAPRAGARSEGRDGQSGAEPSAPRAGSQSAGRADRSGARSEDRDAQSGAEASVPAAELPGQDGATAGGSGRAASGNQDVRPGSAGAQDDSTTGSGNSAAAPQSGGRPSGVAPDMVSAQQDSSVDEGRGGVPADPSPDDSVGLDHGIQPGSPGGPADSVAGAGDFGADSVSRPAGTSSDSASGAPGVAAADAVRPSTESPVLQDDSSDTVAGVSGAANADMAQSVPGQDASGTAAAADPGEAGSEPGAGSSSGGPVEAADAPSPAPAGDLVHEIEAQWGEIRAKVREFGAAVHALLSGASVARVDGDTIVFAHQHAPLAQRLSNPKYVEAVQAAVHAVLGREFGVRWEVGSGEGRAPNPAQANRGSAGPAPGAGGPARGATPVQSEPPRYTRPSRTKAANPETPADAPAARGRESGPAAADSGTRSAPADDSDSPPDDSIPLPDGPDLPEDPGPADYSPVGYDSVPPASTAEEEQEMLAESARPAPPGDRRDPDEVALELLTAELGATRLEG
ncbi:DNA polymerase III subunit gamma and tau [Nocardia sp. BMG51109]|uniref:DNA polymerase III subunit gamma and tau n=1 Tax=Nocardia sp. BMG51109 TaxID=1056816 RepID=UPI0004655B63